METVEEFGGGFVVVFFQALGELQVDEFKSAGEVDVSQAGQREGWAGEHKGRQVQRRGARDGFGGGDLPGGHLVRVVCYTGVAWMSRDVTAYRGCELLECV